MSVLAAVELLSTLLGQATQVAAVVQQAQAQGRANLTADEWAAVTGADDAARRALAEGIARHAVPDPS